MLDGPLVEDVHDFKYEAWKFLRVVSALRCISWGCVCGSGHFNEYPSNDAVEFEFCGSNR